MVDESTLHEVTIGGPTRIDGQIHLAEPDPQWPAIYAREAQRITGILGDRIRLLEHVGSTAVPDLPAKPIIDILLIVPDPADEPAYVTPLEQHGYTLRIREPDWHEHRMLKGPDTDINLHVFGPGCVEIDRMIGFRDRLRTNTAERERYAAEKRALAQRTWRYVQEYADAKTLVVESIIAGADLAFRMAAEPDSEPLAEIVNTVYTTAEAGFWRGGQQRTNPGYMRGQIAAEHIAATYVDGVVAGCVQVELTAPDTGIFGMLAVDPGQRGHGLGGRLIEFAEQRCRAKGATTMTLELLVPVGWEQSTKTWLRRWYERLGYVETARGDLAEQYPELGPYLIADSALLTFSKAL